MVHFHRWKYNLPILEPSSIPDDHQTSATQTYLFFSSCITRLGNLYHWEIDYTYVSWQSIHVDDFAVKRRKGNLCYLEVTIFAYHRSAGILSAISPLQATHIGNLCCTNVFMFAYGKAKGKYFIDDDFVPDDNVLCNLWYSKYDSFACVCFEGARFEKCAKNGKKKKNKIRYDCFCVHEAQEFRMEVGGCGFSESSDISSHLFSSSNELISPDKFTGRNLLKYETADITDIKQRLSRFEF